VKVAGNQHLDSEFENWLDRFELDQPFYAKSIRGFARAEPERFRQFGLNAFQKREFSPGLRCVGTTLVQDPELPRRILNLIAQCREDFVGVVQKLVQCDPFFDLKILELIRTPDLENPIDNLTIARAIDALDRASAGLRLVPLVKRMLDDPDPRIQSKAATFVGRRTQNLDWARKQLEEAEPRVRANIIEALWGLSTAAAAELMRDAVLDGNNRVIGNALLGLYRLGETSSISQILQMAERPEADFRCTAAWVMGATGDPRFSKTLAGLIQDAEKPVRRNALSALQRIKNAISAAAAKGEPRISVIALKQEEGQATLTVLAHDKRGRILKHIAATSWTVTEGGNMVHDCAVTEADSEGPISVIFLAAAGMDPEENEFGAVTAAVRACQPLRTLEDRWALLKVKATLRDSPGKIPVTFARLFPEIEAMLDADPAKAGTTAREAMASASRQVLRTRGPAAEKRHLICIGPAGLEGLMDSLTAGIPGLPATVHAVTLPGVEGEARIRTLVESTGGYFLVAPDADGISVVCSALYAALRQCYELRWAGTGAQVAVKLYGAHGQATATVTG
jgi:hypothetical protein